VSHGKVKRRAIYARDGNTCVYCQSPDNLTLDHVLSIFRGGKNAATNLITCCAPCNHERGHVRIERYLVRLGRRGLDTEAIKERIRYAVLCDIQPIIRAIELVRAKHE